MIDSLIAGLVSGLVVITIAGILREFWLRVIVPWFEDRVYKDARIEGAWFSLYPTLRDCRQEVITLERHGHAVNGTMVCTDGKADVGLKYSFCGSFRNLLLPLVYESQDKSKTDRGTLTLKLVRNAQRLEGKIAVYHSSKDLIESWEIIWFRDKEERQDYLEMIKEVAEEAKKQVDAGDESKT